MVISKTVTIVPPPHFCKIYLIFFTQIDYFVFIPKPLYRDYYPALLVELKWNKDAETALNQIKERKYPESLQQYTGDILLVGINYDKKEKVHQCVIEKWFPLCI